MTFRGFADFAAEFPFLRPEVDEDQVASAFAIILRLEGAKEADHFRRACAAVPALRIPPAPGADRDRPATGPGFKVIDAWSFVSKGRADPDMAVALRYVNFGRQGLGQGMRRRGERFRGGGRRRGVLTT